jgi:hypothetical protein
MKKQTEFESLQESYDLGISLIHLAKRTKDPEIVKELASKGAALVTGSLSRLSTDYFDEFCGTYPKWWWGPWGPFGPHGPGPDWASVTKVGNGLVIGALEGLRTQIFSPDLRATLGGLSKETFNKIDV